MNLLQQNPPVAAAIEAIDLAIDLDKPDRIQVHMFDL
jgi:hypothetical protein